MSQNPQRADLISQIHQSDLRLSLAITGGGSKLVGELLVVPGASRTILDANIPYSNEALQKFLGRKPQSYCSPETSKWMAVCRYFESLRLHESEITAFACTAALATNRDRKGDHRFFTSIQTRNASRLTQVTLAKGKRTRAEEEEMIVEVGLAELGRMINVDYQPAGWTDEDHLSNLNRIASEEWSQVFHKQIPFCHATQSLSSPPTGIGLLSGSFNPLHAGHVEMAENFSKRYGVPTHFELAIQNADKPPLDFLSIHGRVQQFDGHNLWLSNASTFVDKAILFPGNMFIVGIDTITRIADPKYYPGPDGLERALDSIRQNDCRFVVFGRLEGTSFKTLSDVSLPSQLAALCESVSEESFRKDISSTQLRGQL